MDNVISGMRLSELSSKIVQVIETAFKSSSFWVIADVTNHTFKQSSQYHYFELVEKDLGSNNLIAKFSAKSWGPGSQKIVDFERITGQRFQNNINVLIKVTVAYHATFGLQLTLIDIDINYTVGFLEQQRQATLKKLIQDNPDHIRMIGNRYYTANHDLTFNKVIQRIAIISSHTSAGYQDFNHTLENNSYRYKFFIDNYFANIQGDNNAKQFVDKLIEIYRSEIKYDAVIIIRGGGSQTDLIIFDNYAISRAIARFPIPIITGIGHQKNETIADMMANTTTKTPTKAAEFILAHNKLFEDNLLNSQKSLVIKSQQLFSIQEKRLSSLNSIVVNNARNYLGFHKDSLVRNNQLIINTAKSVLFKNKSNLLESATQLLSKPRMVIYNRKSDLMNLCSNLNTFNAMYLKNQRGYLGHYVSLIKLMSPANILNKGFAIIRVNGEITSNPEKMLVGNDIAILIGRQEIEAIVKSTKKYDGSDFNI